MSIKIVSANIEGHRHLERVIPFIQTEQPDIVCFQEVFKSDVSQFESALNMKSAFVPMANVTETSIHQSHALGEWGVAQFTSLPLLAQQHQYYIGAEDRIPVFFENNNPNAMNRTLLWSTLEADGQPFTVATTHFTWSKDGSFTPEQADSFQKLLQILKGIPELVLCGDLNSPRHDDPSNVFSQLSRLYTDNIPPDVETSIDGEFHKAGQLKLMVDSMFCSSAYKMSNVRVVGGVSDHKAVVGEIEYSKGS